MQYCDRECIFQQLYGYVLVLSVPDKKVGVKVSLTNTSFSTPVFLEMLTRQFVNLGLPNLLCSLNRCVSFKFQRS